MVRSCMWARVPTCMLCLTLRPIYVNLLCCLVKICICGCVWSAPSLSPSYICSFSHLSLSLQTRVTLPRQMAFCLAELHLWSTKSSLQVRGSTYHHVQSPSLSLNNSLPVSFLSFTSHSVLLWLFLSSLTLFSHLLTTFPISTLTIWLSVSTLSVFTFSLLSSICVYCIIRDILYIIYTTLNCMRTLFKA